MDLWIHTPYYNKEAEGKKGSSAQYTYLALQDWSTF